MDDIETLTYNLMKGEDDMWALVLSMDGDTLAVLPFATEFIETIRECLDVAEGKLEGNLGMTEKRTVH